MKKISLPVLARQIAVVVVLALGTGVLAGPAQAEEGKWVTKTLYRSTVKCNPDTYKNKRQLVSWARRPVVTHLEAYAIPPSGSHQVTKSATYQTKVTAGARISGGVTVKVQNKIIGEAEARLSTTLQTSGAHTVGKTVSVTDTVANKTSSNAIFPFFKGVMKASGKWRKSFCSTYYTSPGEKFVGYRVWWSYGTWTSFNVNTSGAVRCGAGTKYLNAVAKLALKQGCAG